MTMFQPESYAGHKVCHPGDLVINTMWAWMGALGVTNQTGIVSSSYHTYRSIDNDQFVDRYVDNLLRSQPYVEEYNRRSTGIHKSRLRLYPEEFLKIRVLQPSTQEQQEIVDFVDTATAQMDQHIRKIRCQIDLVREYRTCLIADVVTGKLDVREAGLDRDDVPDDQESDGDEG